MSRRPTVPDDSAQQSHEAAVPGYNRVSLPGVKSGGIVPEPSASNGGDVPSTPKMLPLPRCPCGKWGTYVGNYDKDGYTFRCSGCLRAVAKCRC